jgi:hypothetical protein
VQDHTDLAARTRVQMWSRPEKQDTPARHTLIFYYSVVNTPRLRKPSASKLERTMLVLITPRPRGC